MPPPHAGGFGGTGGGAAGNRAGAPSAAGQNADGVAGLADGGRGSLGGTGAGASGSPNSSAGSAGSIAGAAGSAGSIGGAAGSVGATAGAAGADASGGTAGEPSDSDCDLSANFGAPESVPFGQVRDRTDGRLSSDELTIYFTAREDVWTATRSSISAPFEDEHALINAPSVAEQGAMLAADQLSLYYGVSPRNSSEPDLPPLGLYVSKRKQVSDAFLPGVHLDGLPANAGGPFFSEAGQSLYYVIDYNIWRATLRNGVFEGLTPLTELDGGGTYSYELLTVVSEDEKTIYFGSMRNSDHYDIYVATRAERTDPFSHVTALNPVNSASHEFPNWLSPDGCRLYLHRYADKTWDSPHIMVASKPARPAAAP